MKKLLLVGFLLAFVICCSPPRQGYLTVRIKIDCINPVFFDTLSLVMLTANASDLVEKQWACGGTRPGKAPDP
jgi:hypothetical protein